MTMGFADAICGHVEGNPFVWLPELSWAFWSMIAVSVLFTLLCVSTEVRRIRNLRRLLREFNDGTCPACGGAYEQEECEDAYATYVCPSCGKSVTVDDFDADFDWNWRHYGNTP